VIDKEACGFLEDKFKVDVVPDPKPVRFQMPDEFKDLRRLRKARRTATICNYGRRVEEEARINRRAREKRRREDEEKDSAPPPRRSRWDDDDDEFAVEDIPDFYEDCVSFMVFCFITCFMRW
jgi:hypothetical protein